MGVISSAENDKPSKKIQGDISGKIIDADENRLVGGIQSISPSPLPSNPNFRPENRMVGEFDCREHNRKMVRGKDSGIGRVRHISDGGSDYYAKDYASFRHSLIEQIPKKFPNWKDLSPADIGITLVDLFSYIADELSYYQDRIANEAYVNTARMHSSIRSHLQLIDYDMHSGLAATALIQVIAKSAGIIKKGFQIFASESGPTPWIPHTSSLNKASLPSAKQRENLITFEVAESRFVDPAYNEIKLVPRNDAEQTPFSAILAGTFSKLKKGHYLLFSDGKRKEIVRLTEDPKIIEGNTIVQWSANQYLRLRLDSFTRVHGNILRANHGRTVQEQLKGRGALRIDKLSFELAFAPLTFVSDDGLVTNRKTTLEIFVNHELWLEAKNLWECGPLEKKYAVTVDADGFAKVSFGNGVHGLKPPVDSLIVARYRIGVGAYGNVGEGILTKFDSSSESESKLVSSLNNPLAAFGGLDMETLEEARNNGPTSMQMQERAITPNDYELLIRRKFDQISSVRAKPLQTAGRKIIVISIDVKGTNVHYEQLLNQVRDYLEEVRLIGHDVLLKNAKFVPLEVEISIHPKKNYERSSVYQRLVEAFGSSTKADGQKAFFYPGNFSFGDSVYLSKIYELLESIPGVDYGIVTTFRRMSVRTAIPGSVISRNRVLSAPIQKENLELLGPDRSSEINLRKGLIKIKDDEIPRADSDLSHPENGSVRITMVGERR